MTRKSNNRGSKRSGAPAGGRQVHVKVRNRRSKTNSSARWLQRQLNDPYVEAARRVGYRSRAAFKLAELDDRFEILKPGALVVDLGAAPGGWTQVAVQRVTTMDRGRVIAVDMQEMEPVAGATIVTTDFLSDEAPDQIIKALSGQADVVLSDMAAAATGHRQTDHLRTMALCEAAVDFAARILAPGGCFIGKVLKGGAENNLLQAMKRDFRTVRHAKPAASRADSSESYVVAIGFRGQKPLVEPTGEP
ncbi:MAG: RlmE family RNA methyltransferase [Sphingomonadales bacterium]